MGLGERSIIESFLVCAANAVRATISTMSQAVGQTKPNPHRVISPGSALEEFPNRFKISLPQLVLERVGGDRERIADNLDQFRH